MGILNYDELIGKKYGLLTFVSWKRKTQNRHGRVNVLVRCDCGVSKEVDWDNLRSGKTKSCGCERTPFKYGKDKMDLYKIWTGIKQRCYNPKNIAYKYYGALGVTMSDDWLNDYLSFYNWCIKNGWERGMHIDKDKNGGKIYSAENCVILTKKDNFDLRDMQPRYSKADVDKILSVQGSQRHISKVTGVSRTTISLMKKGLYIGRS